MVESVNFSTGMWNLTNSWWSSRFDI